MCTPAATGVNEDAGLLGEADLARGASTATSSPAKATRRPLRALALWLNASIFLTGWILFFIMLAVNMTVPSQDMGFMIEDLLKNRWPLHSNIPLWVGEWSPRPEDEQFYENILKNDPSTRDTWWNHFISGFLRKYDLDWGYWPLNGEQWQTAGPVNGNKLTLVEKDNGILRRDFSGVRHPAQMESLMQIAGGRASHSTKLPLHGAAGRIVGTDGRRVKLTCVNWFGASDVKFVVGGLNHQPLRRIAEQIAAMGFNCVRLPYSVQIVIENPVVNVSDVLHNRDLHGKRALQVLDRTIAELSKHGIMTILSNHNSEGKWCCKIEYEDGIWATDRYPFDDWIKSMTDLALRYRHDKFVVGMDIRNEIHDWKGKRFITYGKVGATPSTDYKLAIEAAGKALHEANPDWLLIVGGMCFNFDLTMMDPSMGRGGVLPTLPDYSKLVWTAHFYPMSMWWQVAEKLLRRVASPYITKILVLWAACVLYACVKWAGSLSALLGLAASGVSVGGGGVGSVAAEGASPDSGGGGPAQWRLPRWELYCVRGGSAFALFLAVALVVAPVHDFASATAYITLIECVCACLLAPVLVNFRRALRAAPPAGRQHVLTVAAGFMALLFFLVLNFVAWLERLVYTEVGCKYVYEWRFRWTLSWLTYLGRAELDPSPLQ